MAENTVRIGNVTITHVIDAMGNFPASAVFPAVTVERWQAVAAEVATSGMLNLSIGSFLVRAPDRTVLVDTGIGPEGAPAFGISPGRLLDALREAGAAPEEIDVVAITHLHIDHVGWNARQEHGKQTPTFPRARYLMPRGDYEFFSKEPMLSQSPYMPGQVIALVESGHVDLFDGETRLADALTLIPTPGHTPAHAAIAITSGGESGFIIGDVAHHPSQIANPDLRASFDVDQELAQHTREAFWQRIQELGATIAAGHFPAPGLGRIVVTEGRRMWQGIG